MIKRSNHSHDIELSGIARARQLTRGGTQRALGIRLISISPDKVTAEMRIKSVHLSHSGRVTGGVIMAFADAVGAMGAVANLPPGFWTTTLESKTNFFTPGAAPAVSAVSVPLHKGQTTMVWQTTISNADQRTVAIVTQTQIVMPATPASAPRAKNRAGARGGATSRRAPRSSTSRK